MRIVNKKFSELSAGMRKAVRSLSIRRQHDSHTILLLRRESDVDTFLLLDDKNIVLGWAIYSLKWRASYPVVMMYVRKSMRRKGIGSELIKTIRKKHGPKFSVCPWSHESRGFFRETIKKNPDVFVAVGYEKV
jgi:GNAT superfamily N-acetyltransferase